MIARHGHVRLLLTLTSGEGLRYGSLAVSIYCRWWRYRAGALGGLDFWGAGNDGRDGSAAHWSESLGADGVGSGLVVSDHMVWRGCRCGRSHGLFSGDGGPQTQLELRLCGAEERLVDLGLVRVKGDIRRG